MLSLKAIKFSYSETCVIKNRKLINNEFFDFYIRRKYNPNYLGYAILVSDTYRPFAICKISKIRSCFSVYSWKLSNIKFINANYKLKPRNSNWKFYSVSLQKGFRKG